MHLALEQQGFKLCRPTYMPFFPINTIAHHDMWGWLNPQMRNHAYGGTTCIWMPTMLHMCACVCAKLLQLCSTVCNPMDLSPPGSSVHEILHARILEWVAIPSFRGSSSPRDPTGVSSVFWLANYFFFNHEATWGAHKLYKDFQVHRAWYLIENLVQLYHGSSARMSQHLICSFQNPQCGGRASFLCLFSSPWSFPCYFSRNSSSTLPCFQESESHLVVSDSLQPHGLYSPWNSRGQNTEVDSFSFFQGIFATQGSNPGLPHCRQILYDMNQEALAF